MFTYPDILTACTHITRSGFKILLPGNCTTLYTIRLVCKGGCIQWRWSASDVEGDPEDLSQCWVPGLSLRSPCPAPQYCSDVNKSLAVKSDVGSSGNKANSSIAPSEGATVSMHGTHCDNTIVFCLRLRISSL